MLKLRNQEAIKTTLKSFFKKDLNLLIFFVTSKCNLRCKYCFNAENLSSGENDLEFSEVKKMITRLPSSIRSILFSGGEPCLRKDLEKIIGLFVNRGITDFAIPSNGVATKLILETLKKIARKYPQTSLVACTSIDPLKLAHDHLRGPGAYQKAIRTAKGIVHLSQKRKNIIPLVNSVVAKESVPFLNQFIRLVYQEIKPKLHTLDIVRTNPKNENDFSKFSDQDYIKIKNARMSIDKLYRGNDLLYSFYKKRSLILTDIQKKIIKENHSWPVRCAAGRTSAVVYSSGEVAFCENHKPMDNLRKHDYDLSKILNKHKEKYLQMTKKHKCDCNHLVYLRQAVEYNFPIVWLNSLFK